jgi:hypothetical protein
MRQMRFAGNGSDSWHVRVDLLAPDDDGTRVGRVAEALRSSLYGEDGHPGHGAGVDQGTGVEGQPVIGLTFWVRADDLGAAALTALETARRAGANADVGPAYYDVSLVPQAAVARLGKDHTIPMVD